MMIADQDLLTIRDAAAALGISSATIRDWIRRKRINTYKADIGRIKVSVTELREKTTPREHQRADG